MTHVNGEVYDGEWKNGMREGRGKMHVKMHFNGEVYHEVYDGEWKNGMRGGRGK